MSRGHLRFQLERKVPHAGVAEGAQPYHVGQVGGLACACSAAVEHPRVGQRQLQPLHGSTRLARLACTLGETRRDVEFKVLILRLLFRTRAGQRQLQQLHRRTRLPQMAFMIRET